ncbi:MAG: tRNA (adenosine(37)-N6)-threonylcarbamoyltransferase complex ATPase subunit type 1 TsaE [Pseudomonadota bacterium]
MQLRLKNEAATIQLGDLLARTLPVDINGWTVLLEGELGAGKSTLARALIHALGHEGAVPSPTYTLVEPYSLSRGMVYHIDLYRVSSEEELRFLGWNELDEGLRLVEWPERAPSLGREADLRIGMSYDGAGRTAQIEALSDEAKVLIHQMDAADF